MKKILVCLILPFVLLAGDLSYTDYMEKAEKLLTSRYEKDSRAWKIISGRLDQILNSKEPEKEKIRQLKSLIQELEKKASPEENIFADDNGADLYRRGEFAWRSHNFKEAEALLVQAQKKGSAPAAALLGRIYLLGDEENRNISRGLQCLNFARKKGDRTSCLVLGDYYANHANRDFDAVKAENFYLEAVAGGISGAKKNLTLFYIENVKTLSPKQQRVLLEWLPEIAEKEKSDSRIPFLAGKLLLGTEPRKAIAFLKKSLEMGNADAAYLLGCHYGNSPATAIAAYQCFKRGRELGHDFCRMMQAVYCFKGYGCPKNHLLAYELLEIFCRKNKDPEAYTVLGAIYFEGRVVAKNYKKAADFLTKGALTSRKLTDVDHFFLLGCIYNNGGYGITADPAKAADFLGRTKNPEAMVLLGFLYRDGRGVKKDDACAAEFFRKAADAGNQTGMVEFGRCALQGVGMKKDPVLADRYLKTAADEGNPEACRLIAYQQLDSANPVYKSAYRYLRVLAGRNDAEACYLCGNMCHEGRGVAKNEYAAMQYWKKCAELNHLEGRYCYADGLIRAKKEKEALPYLKKNMEAGHVRSKILFAKLALAGKMDKADRAEAVRKLVEVAEQKNHEVILLLGDLYYDEHHYDEACKCYLSASRLGKYPAGRVALIFFRKGKFEEAGKQADQPCCSSDPDAMLVLGRLTLEGKGGRTQDRKKALEYLLKAVKTKDPYVFENAGKLLVEDGNFIRAAELLQQVPDPDQESLLLLGRIFMVGRGGVPVNMDKSLFYLNRAAVKGSGAAMMELGKLYQTGHGVALDYAGALEWYECAMEIGTPGADRQIALMYYHGLGISPDFGKAMEYFLKAAAKEDQIAIYYLSKMYQDGIGTPKNQKEAEKWRRRLYRK